MNTTTPSLGTLLAGFLRESGLGERMTAFAVPGYWAEIVGENAARVSKVLYVENGQLYIEVSAAAWRAELILRREDIRQAINQRCGTPFVREIIIR